MRKHLLNIIKIYSNIFFYCCYFKFYFATVNTPSRLLHIYWLLSLELKLCDSNKSVMSALAIIFAKTFQVLNDRPTHEVTRYEEWKQNIKSLKWTRWVIISVTWKCLFGAESTDRGMACSLYSSPHLSRHFVIVIFQEFVWNLILKRSNTFDPTLTQHQPVTHETEFSQYPSRFQD